MTPLVLAAIEKAATEATQGEWGSVATAEGAFTVLGMDGAVLCSRAPWPHRAVESCANAAFIALANPATILALCERIREPAKVKPLSWQKENIDGTFWTGAAPMGHDYRVKFNGTNWGALRGMLTIGEYDTCDEAKAAAQADYDSRIRSALITETDNG